MKVLVAYETKYGATAGIAERIEAKLKERGLAAGAIRTNAVPDVASYDAFVIGSAVYFGSWLKDATEFVKRNAQTLSTRPVWLFSSGPISAATTDAQGRDLRIEGVPKEIAALANLVKAGDHRLFWGALDRTKLGFKDRLIAGMPAFPGSEGDFRDWHDIDAWAVQIAEQLLAAPREMATVP